MVTQTPWLSRIRGLVGSAGLALGSAPVYVARVRSRFPGHSRRGLAATVGRLALCVGSSATCQIDVPIATPGAPKPAPSPAEAPRDPVAPPRIAHGQPDTEPPEIELELLGHDPTGAVVRPTLLSEEGQTTAGSAFVCALDDASPPLLCTAHHLFGPSGGLSREYAWTELPDLVDRIEGTGFIEDPVFVNAADPLPIEGKPMQPPDFASDFAVFRIRAPGRMHVLTFGQTPPATGDTIFLIAQLQSGQRPKELRHRAVVLDSTAEVLAYKFDDPTIDLRATSGAPMVDSKGRAVGIHLAGAYDDEEGLLGVAVPGVTARAQIKAALAAP